MQLTVNLIPKVKELREKDDVWKVALKIQFSVKIWHALFTIYIDSILFHPATSLLLYKVKEL